MTRGNLGDLQPFDPEIDRTFHRLVRHSVHPDHFEHSVAGDSEYSDFEHSTTNFHIENMAQPPPRETLREMDTPNFTYESLCIQYPDEGVPYVLEIGLIHLLPKFHGLAGKDPHKHLKEFHIVCSTMKPLISRKIISF